MSKVFATLIEDNKVVLKTWPSANAFSRAESWVDNKFIYIATSKEFIGDWLVSAMFDYKVGLDQGGDIMRGFRILLSKEKIVAHNLMYDARQSYIKSLRKTKEES